MTFLSNFLRKEQKEKSSRLIESARRYFSMLEAGQTERISLISHVPKKKTKHKESKNVTGLDSDGGISTKEIPKDKVKQAQLWFWNMESNRKPDDDGGVSTKYWFWGAEFPVSQQVNGPNPPTQQKTPEAKQQPTTQETPEQRARKILIEHPDINGATFLNTLKAKGLKLEFEVSKEADSASSHVAVLRDQKESNRFCESIRFVESIETKPRDGIGPTKFKTILLREGLGNLKDGFFYTRKCLENAIPLFEGQQMFADHPDMLEEKTRPERSVRDLIGHFENLRIEEADDGSALLVGEACLLPDKENEWARSRVLHATEFNKKFPDKDFVALSINANGGAEELPVDQFLKGNELSESSILKVKNAMEKGLKTIRAVEGFEGSFSCDLVTKAGAGGKVLAMLENEKDMEEGGPGSGRRPGGGKGPQKPETKGKPVDRKSTPEYKAWKQKYDSDVARNTTGSELADIGRSFGHTGYYHEPYKGGAGLSISFDDDKSAQNYISKVKSHPSYQGHSFKPGGPKKSSIVKVGFKPKQKSQGESMSDNKEAGEHADEQQDAELIKSMLKKHGVGGEGEEIEEADMQMCKEMYGAYKELGYKEQEALEAAGHSMKLAKHMGAKKEAEVKEADEDKEKEAAKVDDKGYHHEADKVVESLRSEILAMKGVVAKFQEAEKAKEVTAYLDDVLGKSKLPNTVTKTFRESIGTPKTKEQIDRDFKIFMEAYKAKDGEAGNIFIPEKTTTGSETTGSGGFSDCLN